MFSTLTKAWKTQDIRKRLIFTLLMLLVYRLGNNIPIPFIDTNALKSAYEGLQGSIVDYLNMLTGGGLSSLSLFALGVQPYITASIVIQLLTVVIKRLEELSKEGEQGRKQIQRYTRYLTIVIAIFQSIAVTNGLFGAALSQATSSQKIIMDVCLVAGTMLLTWIGEMITDRGMGNGVSLLIFMGIIAHIPRTLNTWYTGVRLGTVSVFSIVLMTIVVILIVIAVVILTQGERRIAVQYAKRVVGRKMYGGQSTNIPVKVNMSGVMPIIFASALLAIPSTISLLMGNGANSKIAQFFTPQTAVGTVIYLIIQSLLIIVFTYFYNTIQFNTVEYANNLRQYGGYIQGIRAGKQTSEFLQKVSSRVTFVGAIGLALLTAIPTIASHLLGIRLSFGGSSVIIIVGVILETMKQMESMMTLRHYKGFLNR